MAIFLLRGSDPEGPIERTLRTTIPGLIEGASLDSILERKSASERDEPATVLVVAPPGKHDYFEQLLEFAEKYHDKVFLILISDDISATDYKRLVRTGGGEWASAKSASDEVLDIISRQRQQSLSSEHLPRPVKSQPVTVSFIPSAGGVGNTTLTVESAIYLKTNKVTQRRNVCIVDLDFQTSHLCDYLDGEARLHIAEFSNAPERLDEHLLDSFKTRHSSGIDVFAAPRSKFASENMSVNALDALFSMIAKRYDLILIDFPLTWFSWTAQVIAACDGAVVTGLNTIPNLRQISETLNVVRSAAAGLKIGIALNRCEMSFFGSLVGRKQVGRVLPTEQLFFIGSHAEASESANMGVPMLLRSPTRRMRDEFGGLASFCSELKSSRVVTL